MQEMCNNDDDFFLSNAIENLTLESFTKKISSLEHDVQGQSKSPSDTFPTQPQSYNYQPSVINMTFLHPCEENL